MISVIYKNKCTFKGEKMENLEEIVDPVKQHNLALQFVIGENCNKNPDKAFLYFMKAAEQSYSNAEYFIGLCYEASYGCEYDIQKANSWFEKAAEHGNEDAQKKLGTYQNENSLSEGNQIDNAEELFNQGANYELGENGVEKDLEKAFSYYKQSAELGYAEAQNYLGFCYDNGNGCEENSEQAFCWYQKAAEQGLAVAQHNLGVCYETGDGCEENLEQAFYWYKKSAEQGYTKAQNKLGLCYDYGNGCEKNPEQAFYWCKKAAEQGLAVAQYNIGYWYMFGNGVEENPEQAFYWYQKAAEQGFADAQNYLGLCYNNGNGCEKNPEQAFFWYKKAAEQDLDIAQCNLGYCYDNGDGCEANPEQAFFWYKKAAEQGDEDSINELENNFAISLYVKYQEFMQKLDDDDLNVFFAYENKEKLWQSVQTFADEATTDEEPILLYDDSALENCKNGFLITSQHLYAKNITSAKNICLDISDIKTVSADTNASCLYFDDTKIETSEIPEDMLNDFAEFVNSIIEKIHSTELYDINLPDFEDIFDEEKGD